MSLERACWHSEVESAALTNPESTPLQSLSQLSLGRACWHSEVESAALSARLLQQKKTAPDVKVRIDCITVPYRGLQFKSIMMF